MRITRRQFIVRSGAVTAGFLGLRSVVRAAESGAVARSVEVYGPVRRDPQGVLDLPAEFEYRIIARVGQTMDDGLLVPGKPDGMAAFPGSGGRTILVCNHELMPAQVELGPFGKDLERFDLIDENLVFERGFGRRPGMGGTTTLVYDTAAGTLVTKYLSLAGTVYNCAGGPTPWGTWISCEETTQRSDDEHEEDHGYNFEVRPDESIRLSKPVPIKAMGRFRHEAVAVDPASGVVYQTEDVDDGLITRYVPERPGELLAGGRLQALAIADSPSLDMRNWQFERRGDPTPRYIEAGAPMAVKWIDLEGIDSPENDLRHRGFAAGAARFARNEGMWYGNDAVYFASTTGGRKRLGQLWRYAPSRAEAQPGEADEPGRLELYIEPDHSHLVRNADNVTVTPWGDLILCEDTGDARCRLIGVTPGGRFYPLATNVLDGSEFAGACFSPDGTTLFVNLQGPGVTLAIRGPWERGESEE